MLDLPSNGFHQGANGSRRTVRFGAFEADLHAGEVRKSGARIKLQEQPFKVLQLLLERPGDLVTREELRSRIWPEESFGDFDHAVNVAVGKLRTALGDSADNPCFIETVPRRGYRFVASLEGAGAKPPVASAVGGPPARRWVGWRRVVPAAAILVYAGVMLALGVVLGRRSTQRSAPEFQRLTVRHGTVYSARFAPDGHNVIYSAAWDGEPVEIFSTDANFSGTRSLGLPGTALLAISSAGQMAVVQSAMLSSMMTLEGTLGEVPLAGGAPRQIAERVSWADWAPDGRTLAIVRDMAGKQRLEFPAGRVLYETTGWISSPRVSPKGDQIAFLDHSTYMDDRGVVSMVDLAGHKRVLSSGWESEEGLAWSPRGNEVLFSATQAGLQRRIYAVDMLGNLRLSYSAPGGVTIEDIAPDGRVLLTRDEQRAGIMGLAPGTTRERDLSWLDWSLPVDLSPDGKQMVFDEQGEQGGPNYTVALRDLTGSPPVPLGEGMAGGFSPDGKWVAATIGYTQLVLLPTGAGTARLIEPGGVAQYGHPVLWLPGSRQLVFVGRLAGQGPRCFVQDIDGGKPRALTPDGVNRCRPSPDGRWIAGRDLAGGQGQLYPLDGGKPRPIVGLLPGEDITWSSDPRFVYVDQLNQVPVKVYRLNIVTGERKLFKELNPADGVGICDFGNIMFSADGRSYIYGFTRLLSDLYLVKGLQ
jgi:DNA-binding winged helix-turn-helix (wHTH) protein/Tol biopolymer transport system component